MRTSLCIMLNKLLVDFYVSSTHVIYACLSKCKTKRQHMYMYIIFKSSIIYFYHWSILTCLNKHHFLNNINCKKIFYIERHCVIILISSKKKGTWSKIYLCSKKFDGWRTLETTISQFWYNMFIEILTWPQGLDKFLDKRNEMFILFINFDVISFGFFF